MNNENTDGIDIAEKRINFILSNPDISPWLRETVKSALDRDPIEVLNDIEILNHSLRYWCEERRRCNSDESGPESQTA